MVGVSDGHLYHLWQTDRGASWTNWEDLGAFSDGSTFESHATIVVDDSDWWIGYGVGKLTDTHSYSLIASVPFLSHSLLSSFLVQLIM